MMDKAGCVALMILVALCSCRAPIPGDVERKGPAGRARELEAPGQVRAASYPAVTC